MNIKDLQRSGLVVFWCLLFACSLIAGCGGSGNNANQGGDSGVTPPPPDVTTTIDVPLTAADVVAGSTETGSGDAAVIHNETDGEISVDLTLSNVTADAVTLRDAYAGATGDIVYDLAAGASADAWELAASPLTADDEAALLAGRLYLHVATAAAPDGILRGQVLPAGTGISRIELEAAQVTGNSTSAGSGRVWATVDDGAGDITVHARITGIDDATSGDIRRALAGDDGPSLATLTPDAMDPSHWSLDTTAFTTEMAGAAEAGELYIEFATPAEPEGAIRGQYIPEGMELVLTDLDSSDVVMGAPANAAVVLSGRVMTTLAGESMTSHANLFEATGVDAVELRQAPAGQNGPAVLAYEQDAGESTRWSLLDVPLTSSLAASLDNQTLYVNVTTPAEPGGVARGQVITAASQEPPDDSAFVVMTVDPPNAATVEALPARIDIVLNREPLPESVSPAAAGIEASGGDGSFGDGNESSITPASVSASGNVVEVSLAGVQAADDVYRVRLSGGGESGIVDRAGIPLDGDGDGVPGGEFESAFELATPQITATLSEIQETIFTPSCATSGCHSGSNPPDGLLLTAGQAYSNTVDVASVQMPSLLRIDPGNPDDSYLVRKVQGTGIVASRMPLNQPPLSQAEIDLIRAWVADGAPDN